MRGGGSGGDGSAEPGLAIYLKSVLMKGSGEKLTFRCKKSKAVLDWVEAQQRAQWDSHSESNSIFHIMQVLIRACITDFCLLWENTPNNLTSSYIVWGLKSLNLLYSCWHTRMCNKDTHWQRQRVQIPCCCLWMTHVLMEECSPHSHSFNFRETKMQIYWHFPQQQFEHLVQKMDQNVQ